MERFVPGLSWVVGIDKIVSDTVNCLVMGVSALRRLCRMVSCGFYI
jgi:hypothetical protein